MQGHPGAHAPQDGSAWDLTQLICRQQNSIFLQISEKANEINGLAWSHLGNVKQMVPHQNEEWKTRHLSWSKLYLFCSCKTNLVSEGYQIPGSFSQICIFLFLQFQFSEFSPEPQGKEIAEGQTKMSSLLSYNGNLARRFLSGIVGQIFFSNHKNPCVPLSQRL